MSTRGMSMVIPFLERACAHDGAQAVKAKSQRLPFPLKLPLPTKKFALPFRFPLPMPTLPLPLTFPLRAPVLKLPLALPLSKPALRLPLRLPLPMPLLPLPLRLPLRAPKLRLPLPLPFSAPVLPLPLPLPLAIPKFKFPFPLPQPLQAAVAACEVARPSARVAIRSFFMIVLVLEAARVWSRLNSHHRSLNDVTIPVWLSLPACTISQQGLVGLISLPYRFRRNSEQLDPV